MNSLTSNSLLLKAASFAAEKSQITLAFQDGQTTVSQTFDFEPMLLLRSNDKTKAITAPLSKLLEIKAGAISAAKMTLLLPAERQFLLLNGWGFGDVFGKTSAKETKESAFTGQSFGMVGGQLEKIEAFSDLLTTHPSSLLPFLENAQLSDLVFGNLLCINPETVPEDLSQLSETFLENSIFLSKSLPDGTADFPSFNSENRQFHNRFLRNVTGIDFSSMWPYLILENFFNLGFETINCNCCKPDSLSAKNLLPSSTVLAEFQLDGFFFESFSQSFAERFHNQNALKMQRLAYKNEWQLNSFPVGPFYRGTRAEILLSDALLLLAEGKLKILSAGNSLKWRCMKHESKLSSNLSKMLSALHQLQGILTKMEKSYLERFGLFYLKEIEKNKLYKETLKATGRLFTLVKAIPSSITEQNYADSSLAHALISLQEYLAYDFFSYSRKQGSLPILTNANFAFLRTDSAFSLAKGFFSSQKLPLPEITERFDEILV